MQQDKSCHNKVKIKSFVQNFRHTNYVYVCVNGHLKFQEIVTHEFVKPKL